MFFGGEICNLHSLACGLIVFMAFSLIASSVYCYNDIVDADDDRHHPMKCTRPVASGDVTVPQAYTLMGLTLVLGVAIVFALPPSSAWEVAAVLLGYYVLNLAYCSKLKQYAILDVCIVAFGFVLRIIAGGIAEEVELSQWIVLMTFLLTLFLSFAKRRDDVERMNETGEAPRRNTIRYNLTFINQAITITASVTLMCYIMYTMSSETMSAFGTEDLYLTSVPVLLGLLRYIQIAVVDKKSGDPVRVMLHDRFSQFIVAAWLAMFLFLIYVI